MASWKVLCLFDLKRIIASTFIMRSGVYTPIWAENIQVVGVEFWYVARGKEWLAAESPRASGSVAVVIYLRPTKIWIT
jgi:hypothetical protein